jgi:hypothetical protein
VQDEIAAVVEACGEATLKVILEVSELETYDNIRAASFLAMRVMRPGDFIKTSTGKTSLNATLGNNQVMLEAIRDFYLDTGIAIAMKPAGGIRTAKQALHVSHRDQGDARRRVAQQHALPLRRLLAAQRPAPPDREGAHRRLPGAVLLQRSRRVLLIRCHAHSAHLERGQMRKNRPTPDARPRPPAPELIFGDLWEYDPAPETADPKLKPRYDLFIGGKFVAPASGKYFDSINPANETEARRARARRSGRCRRRLSPPRAKAFETVLGQDARPERAKYIYRIARLLQDRAREFAVAETMDGGKPIKESRDFDVPMAAAHFFYHAGWADKLDYVAPGRKVAPLGVVGQVIPWNFPLLMLAWKLAPALAMGNTRRHQAGRDHQHHRAEARRDFPGRRPAARRRQHRHRPRRHRRGRS